VRRGFTEAYVALDDGFENHFPEVVAEFGEHLAVHLGASVVHGDDKAFY